MSKNRTLICVSVKTDGPCAGLYSLIQIGAVRVDLSVAHVFYAQCAPITDLYVDSYYPAGFSRNQHERFDNPRDTLVKFVAWVKGCGPSPVFISQNASFDWQFINYYLCLFEVSNPFVDEAKNIRDLYCGLIKDMSNSKGWMVLTKTRSDGLPLTKAKACAEAMLHLIDRGLKY